MTEEPSVSHRDLSLARDAKNKLLDLYNRIKDEHPHKAQTLDRIIARLEEWVRA